MPKCKEIPEYISATTLFDLINHEYLSPNEEADVKKKFAEARGTGHGIRWYYKTRETLACYGREPYICENGWLRSRKVVSQSSDIVTQRRFENVEFN